MNESWEREFRDDDDDEEEPSEKLGQWNRKSRRSGSEIKMKKT